MRGLVMCLAVLVTACDRAVVPAAKGTAVAATASVAPATGGAIVATPSRTVATTAAPTPAPTAAVTATPPSAFFKISGTVVYADNAQPVARAVTSAYASTDTTFCATWNAAANGAGPFPIARIETGIPPAYTIANLPAGSYVVVTWLSDAPQNKWFWRFGGVPTLSCDQSTRINLRADAVADFKVPR